LESETSVTDEDIRRMSELLRATMNEVASRLGYTLKPKSDADQADPYRSREATIVGPSGEEIWVSRNGNRLDISAVLPPDLPHPLKRNRSSIGLALNRGARVIASEIERRLLPGYAEDLALARTEYAQASEAKQSREAIAARLRAAIPDMYGPLPLKDFIELRCHRSGADTHGDVLISGRDHIEIKLYGRAERLVPLLIQALSEPEQGQ